MPAAPSQSRPAHGGSRPDARTGSRDRGTGIPLPGLALLAAAAVLIHGYHLGADDAAIYVPAIKRAADPALYPYGGEFFLAHARLSVFPNLIGGSARLLHVPTDAAILAWHAVSLLLLLSAAWRLLARCFVRPCAHWCGVAVLAVACGVPVAGTGLVIMDPYLTARSLSTPSALFAIGYYLSGNPVATASCLLLTTALHPQMAVYATLLVAAIAALRRVAAWRSAAQPALTMAAALPFGISFAPVSGPARECLLSRSYFFVATWTWYQWIGVFAPLALLAWWRVARPRGVCPAFLDLAGGLLPFGIVSIAAAVVLGLDSRWEAYTRLQPMRSFHLLYAIFFLLLGGLLGEHVLRAKPLRWVAVFAPAAVLMTYAACAAYPASRHIEWPGGSAANRWVSAFLWIRGHTPKSAVFALDPEYMARTGEDAHGFRAVAERSVLADSVKDSGAVSLFPQLAPEWAREVAATRGLDRFRLSDYRRLAAQFPVTWILTSTPPRGLECPYRNSAVSVCRL
jgi:hypothetical protein